ncbi:Acyl-N-acyltransferase [Cordyceps militaris]|uniref:Glucosamine 6-phosphate N-acetyltransferase n=1 Tax=Cordyceps militaris TaxID=73501 RepID=A0A2H4SNS8_CORMI|nr:Acyl-N-acyltransferase [Cordyceps militaris]
MAATTSTNTPLFPASLISPDAASAFPAGYEIRPLQKGDYAKGFIECLRDLTWMGDMTEAQFHERYDELDTGGKGPYYYLVVEHAGHIVGTGLVLAEKKFIHNRCTVGHIEEICIAKDHQSKGLGRLLMNALNSVADNAGCCKTILNCSEKNQDFYKKCGYEGSGLEMVNHVRGKMAPQ